MSTHAIRLDALSADDVEQVRKWRAETPSLFRTRVPMTVEMQQDFYRNIVCDRRAEHRYWAVRSDGGNLVGQVGLVGIEWENGLGEVSLVIAPDRRASGYGPQVVELLLTEAFDRMRLVTVWGECYGYNEHGITFWRKEVERYQGHETVWPRRKWWNGRLHDSMLFLFTLDGWKDLAGLH